MLRPSVPISSLVTAGLLALGVPAAAQNYRLSAEPPSNWLDSVGSFVVAGDQVVFSAGSQSSSTLKLWSVPADRSTAPIQLHDSATQGTPGRFDVTPDGTWMVYLDHFRFSADLIAKRLDGSGGHFLSTPLPRQRAVVDFLLSPDSARAVWRMDRDQDEVYELYSRAIDGSTPEVKLNGTLVGGGDVQPDYQISPDGAWVVYRADQETDEVFDLYAVPIDGSGPAVRLNTSRPLADVQSDFQISHDSLGVAYRADADTDEMFELYVARIDGSTPPLKRSGALVTGGDVSIFAFTPNDLRLVYRADQDQNDVLELYSVPTFAGTQVKLNGAMVSGGDVFAFEPSPDGLRVVFTADQDTNDALELFVVSAAGGPAPLKLHADMPAFHDVTHFVLSADGTRVAFAAGLNNLNIQNQALYAVPIDASTAPVRLSALPHNPDQSIYSFLFTPDGARLVYSSDEDTQGVKEFYSVPSDGSAAPVKLNGPIVSGGTSSDYALTRSGRVVFSSSVKIATLQLFSVPLAGGTPLRLNEPFTDHGRLGDVTSVILGPDGRDAFYTTRFNSLGVGDLMQVELDQPRRATRLSGPSNGVKYSQHIGAVAVSPDGNWVVYEHFRSSTSAEINSVGRRGSPAPVHLNVTATSARLDRITPDSSRVVFHGFGSGLRSAPIDGSAPAVLLEGGDVAFVALCRDGSRVVYVKFLPTGNELWSVPTLGGQAPTRLDGPLVAGGGVSDSGSVDGKPFEITPDGQRVVYVARQDTNDVRELYSVPIDGSAPAVKINAPMVSGGDVQVDISFSPPFALTPDGTAVVYLADQDTDDVFELYRAPTLGGGPSVKLSGPLVAGGDVGGNLDSYIYSRWVFQISADGTRVVYMADATTNEQTELYSVPLDGSAPAVRVSGALLAGSDVFDFGIAPSSDRAVYRVQQSGAGIVLTIHSVPIAGGPPVDLGEDVEFVAGYGPAFGLDGFRFTSDGQEVVFASRTNDPNTVELFHAVLDGSAPALAVNGPLVPHGDATSFGGNPIYALTPDGSRVVYVADQDADEVYELFATFIERRPRRSGSLDGTVIR